MCSETSSPRLSFSHDLSDSERQVLPLQQDVHVRQDSNSDFEFITSNALSFESPSADELFSNGVILPIQIQQEKTTNTRTKHPHTRLPPRPCSPIADKLKKETIRELLEVSSSENEKKPHCSKSFWRFNRSKSLNCDTKKSLICSLSLLSRSNSTGSAPNPKKMSSNKQQSSTSSTTTTSSSSALNLYPVQKSPSGKGYGNGVRISPVLNMPTPYVSKGGSNLFGLGSFLGVGKVKKSNK